MKTLWHRRDNAHRYFKRRADAFHKGARSDFVYQCAHCESWVSACAYEEAEWTIMKRPITNFCARSQGMLFDRRFRLERRK